MLIDRNGATSEAWNRVSGADAATVTRPLVPFAEIDAALAALSDGAELGIEVPNTIRLAALEPHLVRVALVSIVFPAFSDGRGFSLGRQLREYGYAGRLRAAGPLITDQFPYALACGFDEVDLPEASAARQPPELWVAALGVMSNTYQRGYQSGGNILDQRRAARRNFAGGRP